MDRMLRQITPQQFLEWRAFDLTDSFSDVRVGFQAASICATVMNAAALQAGSKTRFKVKDFMLTFGEQSEEVVGDAKPTTSWQQMKFIAKMHVAASAADNTRKRKR